MRLTRWFHVAQVSALVAACNALDEPGPKGNSAVFVPTDARPAVQALTPPPAISGGTLAATADGRFAVAADPDRDRVSIVDLQSAAPSGVRHVALTPGDRPGRVVTDAAGYAYVALRRAGEVALIDVEQAALVKRAPACADPRGLALDPRASALHVACGEGRLVSLRADPAAADALAITRDLHVEDDLRDVVVQDDALQLTTFKRAELLTLAADGSVSARQAPRAFSNTKTEDGGFVHVQPLQAHVAWRSVRGAGGAVFMLHQGSTTDEVEIDKASLSRDDQHLSPYGGTGGNCEGIVVPALTRIGTAPGDVMTTPIASGVLTVDLALSNDGAQLALVQAGSRDTAAPAPQVVFDEDQAEVATPTTSLAVPAGFPGKSSALPPSVDPVSAGSSQLTLLSPNVQPGSTCERGTQRSVVGQATAVAFAHRAGALQDDVVVQSREPALLTIIRGDGQTVVDLGGENMSDTGHDIFHRDAGGGVACASCHPEGAEDGHVWKFNTVGVRRTQALHVGLEGTAPFHWNGEEADLGHLMEDVFVGRMGGVHENASRLATLTRWLYALQPPAAGRPDDAQAVARGQALFQSPELGCAGCHNGDKLTDNQTVDVGTGAKLQVPSLRAVGYRAPFMHTGCAPTLRERFDPACGGSRHGNTAGLGEPQLGDLIAYLKTL